MKVNEMKSTSTIDKVTKVLAELFGTTILIFLGCLGCIGSDVGLFKIALNFGLTVMTVVHCFGCVSGAHLSPAITLAAWIMDTITPRLALAYVGAQLLGCYLGYALLMYLIPTSFIPLGDGSGFCLTMPHSDVSYMQATAIEFAITATLVLFACSIWDPRNAKDGETAPIRFCLAIVALALSAGNFSGASMNPARSFAPALWNSNFKNQCIYWFGPLGGAVVSAYIYKYVFWREVVH